MKGLDECGGSTLSGMMTALTTSGGTVLNRRRLKRLSKGAIFFAADEEGPITYSGVLGVEGTYLLYSRGNQEITIE